MKRDTIPHYLLGIGLFEVIASLTWEHWLRWLNPFMFDTTGK